MILRLAFFTVALLPLSAFGWDGYDYETGSYIEISKGNLVRPGHTIEVYDYGEGEFKEYDVQSMRRVGANVELEVADVETGELRTFEMDGRR